MIVEEGEHRLLDGTMIQAGRTKVSGKWRGINFGSNFKKTPAVFAQITT
jgi:hypothetical protein